MARVSIARSLTGLRGVFLSFFFLSGITGLVYEVVWARRLTLIFGTTLYSVSTILTVYMAGLALGALLFGRMADRTKRPLRYYALLEIGIGLYAFLTPLLFNLVDRLQLALYGAFPAEHATFSWVRFVIAFLALITPTIFMGGTLPVMAKFFVSSYVSLGRWVGWLYFANTFGAVFGAILAGFFLTPTLGVTFTIFATATLNVSIGLAVYALEARLPHGQMAEEVAEAPPEPARRQTQDDHYATLGLSPTATQREVQQAYRRLAARYHPDLHPDDKTAPARFRQIRRAHEILSDPAKRRRFDQSLTGAPSALTEPVPLTTALLSLLIAAAFVSGFSSLSLEVAWTRALSLVLGSSVYAFALMLAAFLTGIALGSLLISFFADRAARPWPLLALFLSLNGLSILLFSSLMDRLPVLFLEAYRITKGSFWALQPFEMLISFTVMLIPTTLMGAAFPLAIKLYTQSVEAVGKSVGQLYFANTVGALLGSLITGFVLIPNIGMQSSIKLAAAIYLVIGSAAWLLSPATSQRLRWASSSLAMVVAVGGFFVLPSWDRAVMTSGVFVIPGQYTREAEQFGDIRRILGSGNIQYYREGLTATVVVKLAGETLSLIINGKADASTTDVDMDTQLLQGHLPMLLNPNAKRALVVGLGSGVTTGAMLLYPSLEQLDLVEIEPAVVEANSYFASANNNALADPRTRVVTNDARNFIAATQTKYDVISAEPSNPWIRGVSNLFAKEQFELYRDHLTDDGIMVQWFHLYSMSVDDFRMVANTFLAAFPYTLMWSNFWGTDVFLIGSKKPLAVDYGRMQELIAVPKIKADLARMYQDDPLIVLSYFAMDQDTMARFAQSSPIHTDDRPLLEFAAPRNLYSETAAINVRTLMAFQSDPYPYLVNIPSPSDGLPGQGLRDQLQTYAQSRKMALEAEVATFTGSLLDAVTQYEEAIRVNPNNRQAISYLGELHAQVGNLYYDGGLYEQALQQFQRAKELRPQFLAARRSLALSYAELGKTQEAIQELNSLVANFPNDAPAYLALGVYLENQGNALVKDQRQQEAEKAFADAEAAYKRSIEVQPENYIARNYLADFYIQRNQSQLAIRQLQLSLRFNPNQPQVAKVLQQLGAIP